MGSPMVVVAVVCVGVLMVSSLLWVARDERRRKDLEHARVELGDLWGYIGPDFDPPVYRQLRASEKRKGVYQVVAANTSKEAGADSWVMRSFDGRTMYMHHRQRAQIDSPWILCMRAGRPMMREVDAMRYVAAMAQKVER